MRTRTQPSPSPRARRHRTTLVAFTIVAAACSGVISAAIVNATGDPNPAAADSSAAAERGAIVQVNPLPPPPSYGGCLTGTVAKVSASVDPQQRWWVGTVSANWKVVRHDQVGPKGPVIVVGDSLTLGSETNMMRDLLAGGYGPICIDGGVARRMTVGATSSVSNGVLVIDRIRKSDPVWRMPVVRWVLAIGTNDARMTNLSSFPTTIAAGKTAVGVSNFPLVWVDVRTRVDYNRPAEDKWNRDLVAAGVRVAGWAPAVDESPATYINDTDKIHLLPAGNVLRGQLVRAALDAT